MTKETAKERQARIASEEAARRAIFLAGLPARIFQIKNEALRLQIAFMVDVDELGTKLIFSDDDNGFYDDVISYKSEEHEVEWVERKLREINEAQEARKRRWNIAQDVWNNKLTKEEKAALKEFISNLL